MRKKRYSSEGIILSRKNFSEADRIIKIYTKKYGKLTCIAKGIRKPKSKKRGSLEVFSRIKFSAARGKSMDILIEVESIELFSEIRDDLKKVSLGYYFMEVIDKITEEEEQNTNLYSHIIKNLRTISKTKKLKKLRKRYVYEILSILGYWPKNKKMDDPDKILEEVVERKMVSERVGKTLFK